MHLPYEAQLAEKRARVARALARYPELTRFQVGSVAPADPPLSYRTRAKWVVGPRGEVGLFARTGDHEVVDIPGCLVASPRVVAIGDALRGLVRAPEHAAIAARLRSFDVRIAHPEGALVTLGLAPGRTRRELVVAFARALQELAPEVLGVAASEGDPRVPRVLSGRPELVVGATEITDATFEVPVLATFGAFVQAHAGQTKTIEARLVTLTQSLGSAPRVLELFAGSGAFGLALAKAGAVVECVESFPPAADRIERAASAAGLTVRAHVEDAERYVLRAARPPRRVDVVLVDPPRRGLSPALRGALAALEPRAIAYVSCDPETFARDAAHFERLGYRVDTLEALDMIPQSDEVECLAWLVRATPLPLAEAEGACDGARGTEDVRGFIVPAHGVPPDRAAIAPAHGASGVAVVGEPAAIAFAELVHLALVKGVPRKKGHLRQSGVPIASSGRETGGSICPSPRLHYVRVAAASGHALVLVGGGNSSVEVLAALARIGHPVLGDGTRCDRATNRHFLEKHGLDRVALHLSEVALKSGARFSAPWPGDLAMLADRLKLSLAPRALETRRRST